LNFGVYYAIREAIKVGTPHGAHAHARTHTQAQQAQRRMCHALNGCFFKPARDSVVV
jgi:hypothetical protein